MYKESKIFVIFIRNTKYTAPIDVFNVTIKTLVDDGREVWEGLEGITTKEDFSSRNPLARHTKPSTLRLYKTRIQHEVQFQIYKIKR